MRPRKTFYVYRYPEGTYVNQFIGVDAVANFLEVCETSVERCLQTYKGGLDGNPVTKSRRVYNIKGYFVLDEKVDTAVARKKDTEAMHIRSEAQKKAFAECIKVANEKRKRKVIAILDDHLEYFNSLTECAERFGISPASVHWRIHHLTNDLYKKKDLPDFKYA